jgi:mono/diheme cytochrome c family protein
VNRFTVVSLILLGTALPHILAQAKGPIHWSAINATPIPETAEMLADGRRLYGIHCTRCHGYDGRGNGPDAKDITNKPRDFGAGFFKARTTSPKGFPSDLDLFRTITAGFPAFDMPALGQLSERDRWALVYHTRKVIASAMEGAITDKLKKDGEVADAARIKKTVNERMRPGKLVKVPKEPGGSRAASIRRGKITYIRGDYRCANCHGPQGKGDGPNAATMKDEWGFKISPRDITKGARFRKFVYTPEDMVRVILTGIHGTPMPSFDWAATFPDGIKEIWDVARYVESLEKK